MKIETLTDEEYRNRATTQTIEYGTAPSPFGECVIAVSDGMVCLLDFPDGDLRKSLSRLEKMWPEAEIKRDDALAKDFSARIFGGEEVKVLLKGSGFNLKVWKALTNIPKGKTSVYSDIARVAGKPLAARAVGTAVGRNPVSYLVPCHRVLRRDGTIGGYAWGVERKIAILESEGVALKR